MTQSFKYEVPDPKQSRYLHTAESHIFSNN